MPGKKRMDFVEEEASESSGASSSSTPSTCSSDESSSSSSSSSEDSDVAPIFLDEEDYDDDDDCESPVGRKRRLHRVESSSSEDEPITRRFYLEPEVVLVIFTGAADGSVMMASARESDMSKKAFRVLNLQISGSDFIRDSGIKNLVRRFGSVGNEVNSYILKLYETKATNSQDLCKDGRLGPFARAIILNIC